MRTYTNLAGAATISALLLAPFASAGLLSSSLFSTSQDIEKRQSTAATSSAIGIPPSQYWEGNDGPWSSFFFGIGVNQYVQNVRLMIGTSATSVLAVAAGSGCPQIYQPNCEKSRGDVFNTTKSFTWAPNSIYQTGVEESLGLSFSANTGFDTVQFGIPGQNLPSVQHTVVFAYNPSDLWVGIFGLSPYPTNFTNYITPQTSFLSVLSANGTIPSTSYGYTAGNQYRLNGVYGSLTLGGYDLNRFSPTGISFPMYGDISKDLSVVVQGITTDSGSISNLLPGGPITMFIDSTVAQIWLPASACAAFEQAFGITYDTQTGLYLVNSTLHSSLMQRNPNVTFNIGGTQGGSTVSITLPYGAFNLNAQFPFVANGNSTPYFPLRRAANSTQYTLGRTFLQEAYIIADYDRGNFTVAPCSWDINKINTALIGSIRRVGATTFDSSSSNSNAPGISAGAVAGIVIGIVAAIALIGLLIWFLRRRRNAEKKRVAELDAVNPGFGDAKAELSADPSASAGKTDGTFYGPQKGGAGDELDGEPIHEMTAAERVKAQELDARHTGKTLSEMEAGGEYYAPDGKLVSPAVEMAGQDQIYEMPGSDVQEMPAHQPGRDIKY